MQLKVQDFKLHGVYTIEHRDKFGNLISRETIDNTVSSAAKADVANKLQGASTSKYTRIALDASSTAAAAANTTLASEITSPSLKRAAATNTRVTTNVTNDTSQLVHTFTSTATQAVNGCGVFDTPTSGGTLLSRITFTTKNLTSGDTLQVTHKLITA